jgi:TonB family protein
MKTIRLPSFETGLLLSLLLHVGLWQVFSHKGFWESFSKTNSSLEIDLTRPFRIVTDPSLARRAKISGTGAPVVERPSSLPPALAPVPRRPPKEWVLPGPQTRQLEKPAEQAPVGTPYGTPDGTGEGLGGRGDGTGWGEVDLVYLTSLPRILNREELARNLRRFYPEAERRAGREGDVQLDVHIDPAGRVSGVDVVGSAGTAFDDAAKKVIQSARFSPAMVKEKAVAVKIRQTIAFRLE